MGEEESSGGEIEEIIESKVSFGCPRTLGSSRLNGHMDQDFVRDFFLEERDDNGTPKL